MEEVSDLHSARRWWRAASIAFVGALALSGCREELQGGAACPSLCPEQQVAVRDTTIAAVVLDSTIAGVPPVGSEPELLIAQRGDTLATGAILRFDTLFADFPRGAAGDTITHRVAGLDAAELRLAVSSVTLATDSVTFDIFNVDTTAADFDLAADRLLFRPDRLLTSRTFSKDSLAGILRIALPPESVAARLLSGRRLRLGLRARSAAPVQLRFFASPANASAAAVLTYKARSDRDTPAVRDTLTIASGISSRSSTGSGDAVPALADYSVIFRGDRIGYGDTLTIGGIPAARAYLRFDVPARILDSSTIVRAALLLNQIPNRGFVAADTVRILPRAVLAAPQLDPGRSSLLLQALAFTTLPSLLLTGADSGVKRVELVNLLRRWKTDDPTKLQRSLVLQSAAEGTLPGRLYFYSTEASDPAVRPRLQIDYIPRTGTGLP